MSSVAAVRRAASDIAKRSKRFEQTLTDAYNNGATVEQLADAVGVTEEAMRQRLHGLGVKLRGRGRPPKG